MSEPQVEALGHRLLIHAPIGKDSSLIEIMLRKNRVRCTVCRDLGQLSRELERGAAGILITEEAYEDHDQLGAVIASQPPWSDLPVLLLTRPGADSVVAARALEELGNVTLLERPVRVAALASAVRSALRARERQYQARKHLEEREQASRRKDQFLATLAHELRNPLAPLRNSLNLLRLSDASQSAALICEVMERQVNQLVRLVDDLIDLSRITRGKIELRRETVDLAAVIDIAVETSRPLIDSAEHELAVATSPEPLVLHADAMRLAQVFSNLLNNAAKYTDTGGKVSISALREGEDAVVTISDTGVGISPHALSSVFEMFTQGNARDSRSQTGLGIGLTLARSIVEMHGGKVTAASEGLGLGSQFIVRLPLGSGQRADNAAPPAAAPEIRESQRIVVVDDNRDSADTLGALLELLGAQVRVAYDGQSALEAFQAFHPSAVVLDLGMPGMDGYEVARRIRELSQSSTLIALTGWGQEKDRRLTEAAGFHHHLVKPVDIDTMRAVLATLPQ